MVAQEKQSITIISQSQISNNSRHLQSSLQFYSPLSCDH